MATFVEKDIIPLMYQEFILNKSMINVANICVYVVVLLYIMKAISFFSASLHANSRKQCVATCIKFKILLVSSNRNVRVEGER